MLAAGPIFGLLSRALSRCYLKTNILAWSYTHCSISKCHRHVWQQGSGNAICEIVQQNGKFVALEEDLLQNMQQNGCFTCSTGDLLWFCKHVVSREYLKWARKDSVQTQDFMCEKQNTYKGLNKISVTHFDYNRGAYFDNCWSIANLPWKKQSNSGAPKWPVASNKLNFSCFYQGMLVSPPSRNLHSVARMYNSSYTFLSPETLHGKIRLRHKSFGSAFKKLFLKLLKDKDLEVKEEVLKEIATKTSQKETEARSSFKPIEAENSNFTSQILIPTKELPVLSDLIYGCMSSKHLLDLMIPWIENETVSIEDTVKAIEHLQNLVYSEIMELYPDLPYGSVSIMYENLKLLQAEKKVFNEIHDHVTLQTMIEYLKRDAEFLTNSQFVTCFSCLTHLGISHFHPVMGKFYVRLMNSDSTGYSSMDIVNLYNVAKCHSNTDFVLAAYVISKLSECLKGLKSHVIDIGAFRAMIFVAENIPFGLEERELVQLYSCLYKVSMETNCLNNLNCACELLLHLNNRFYIQKHFVHVSSIYFQLLETHRHNIIQAMSDQCIEKIKGRSNELSPLKIKNLITLSKSCLKRTNLQSLLRTRVEYLLKQSLHQLSLPEIIWLLSDRAWNIELEAEDMTSISRKFEKLDLPNLYEAWSMGHFYVKKLGLGKYISEKTLEYKNEIIKEEKLYIRALTFGWGMWYKTEEEQHVDTELDFVLQNMLLDVHERGGSGFKTRFACSLLMTLPRFSSLQPSSLDILSEIARKQSTYKVLSQGNIFVILNALFSCVFKTGMGNESVTFGGKRGLYESVMFCILYKTVVEFNRTMQQESLVMHVLIRTTNLLLSSGKMDCVLQTRVYEKLTQEPLQYVDDLIEICNHSTIAEFLKIDKVQRIKFLKNVVTFALQNKEHLTFRDWKRIVHFLLRSGFSAHDNNHLQKTLQTVVYQKFSLGPEFCNFVNQCCRLGVDMSEALKIIFSVEYLKRTDQLISENVLDKNSMQRALFQLNQVVCVSYPSLKVPWFQEEGDAFKAYERNIYYWKYIPKDLHYAITRIAGGDRFVGKEVFLDFGMLAWRVLLVDEQNQPVEFTTWNLKQANEMKYQIFIIWYIMGALVPGAVQVPFEMMIQAGYKAVVIYRTEWHSLGLPTIDDKIEFLKKKIFESSAYTDVHDPPMVNCKRVSDQWKTFLEVKR